jgi:predicted membrane metal-binding protein
MPWINQKTDRNVEYVESMWTFLSALWYTGLLFGGVILLYVKAKHVLLNPLVWTVVIFFVLFVSYAGFVFDILNNAPWSGQDDKGRETLIASGSRT